MPRGFLDFTAEATGATPAGFAAAETRTGVTLTVEAEAGAGGGKVLRLQYVGASGAGFGRTLWVYTGGPLAADGETVEVAARVRLANIGGSAQAYTVGLRTEGTEGIFGALLAGTERAAVYGYGAPQYAASAFSWDPALWYQLRLRSVGDTLTMLNVWPDGADPGGWLVPAAATPAARNSGHLALALQFPLNSAGTYLDVDWIGWATGGASAPLQALAPPVAGFTAAVDFVTVTVTSTAADPDGTLALIEYDFGAGDGWTMDTAYTYPEFGAYTIAQRVTDSDGQQATDSLEVTTGSAGRATLAEFLLWASGEFVTHVDVQIERMIGGVPTFQSYRDFGGWNWIRSVRWAPGQVDRGIGSGSVTLHRQRGAQSLAPLVTESPLNQDGGDFSPALDFGREIRILTADTPTTGRVTAAADADPLDTLLEVEALDRAVGVGSIFHFTAGAVTVAAEAAAGATAIDVEPIPGGILAGAEAPVSFEPAPDDWRLVFEGRTDDPDWGEKDSARVEVPFRDFAGTLADTTVRDPKEYGAPGGLPLDDVAQEIADDWMGAGQYPLAGVPAFPLFTVTGYKVGETNVYDALERLADQAGAVVRQEWIEVAGAHQVAIVTPPRDKTEPDYPVGPSTYLDVHNVRTAGEHVRTIVRAYGFDRATGAEIMHQVPAEAGVPADAKVQLYGPRFMQLGEDAASAVDTLAELTAFVESIYADVSSPPIPLEPETRYCWFAAPDQVARWLANTLLWDQPLDAAVLGLSHELAAPGAGRTRWRCGGTPKGRWLGWTQRGAALAGRNARPAGFYNFTRVYLIEDQETATHFALGWDTGPGVTVVRGAALLFQSGSINSDVVRSALINAAVPVEAPLMVPKASRAPQFALAMLQVGWVSAAGVDQWGMRAWQPIQPPPAFAPVFLSLDVDGQKLRAVGQNVASYTLTRLNPPVGGEYTATLDGATATFDLAAVIGSADVWEVEVRAFNDPQAEWDSDTISVAETRIVRGPTAPASAIITGLDLAAPLVGDDTVEIEVATSSAAGHTLHADVRWWLGSDLPTEWTESVATTPALTAPGGTQTVTIDTGHTRAGGYADGSEVTVNYEVRIRARDGSGNTVDSEARVRSWYIEAEAPL